MNTPTEIRLDTARRALALTWADGDTRTLTHVQLRAACPCADCRTLRLRGNDVEANPDVVLTGIEPAGYGVQLVFSDGHARGIYPWPYLEALAARRDAD
ncbi:gamma-butyrobetaine hydroxylase-like domain-containing protein [Pararobbsia silviterrae]|uniref:DUF971 domain-containing protein n=1 Tax=Pararobbsia silviterrae TaxID=1792498 RepID=A0A494XZX9_9BURK|nr:gamma-butyrobetaine hydroxylase-like domain-containing protein [Pararobbsia silviterrae]RKP56062.1 DUF971 domain-containing protein [Pararobbsia silviterrae]